MRGCQGQLLAGKSDKILCMLRCLAVILPYKEACTRSLRLHAGYMYAVALRWKAAKSSETFAMPSPVHQRVPTLMATFEAATVCSVP